jgi:hypothetical protein
LSERLVAKSLQVELAACQDLQEGRVFGRKEIQSSVVSLSLSHPAADALQQLRAGQWQLQSGNKLQVPPVGRLHDCL